jgi:uncharacterized protein (TIGR01244 family)
MKNEAIIDGITVAGQPTDEEITALRERGFTTLINVRVADELDQPEAPKAAAAGLQYAEIGFTGGTLRTDHIKQIRQLIDDSTGPVAIHCAGGTRAAVVAAIISAEKAGQSAKEALHKITEADFDVEGTPYELFIHRYFHA